MHNDDKAGPARKRNEKNYREGYETIFGGGTKREKLLEEATPLEAAIRSFEMYQKLTYGETLRLIRYCEKLEQR